MRSVDISKLMSFVGLDHKGIILLTENMSGLENNPKDDWLYLALLSLKSISERYGRQIESAAFIGSGNGIDVIAAIDFFKSVKKIIVTDIVEEILPQIQKNVNNRRSDRNTISISYLVGRDCDPLRDKVDFIYANLPLIMVDPRELEEKRATTTLTDKSEYDELSVAKDDLLLRYSLLPQLGFLLSAKEKLKENGRLITLIGGRVPTEAIDECFKRAGFKYEKSLVAFIRQSDPEFLKEYSDFEQNDENTEFIFYNYKKAKELLSKKGIAIPEVINTLSEEDLKGLLKEAQIGAKQAYQLYKEGKDVGHLAYAFEATVEDSTPE